MDKSGSIRDRGTAVAAAAIGVEAIFIPAIQ